MMGLAGNFFSSDGLMPHGHCYLWRPELVVAHVTADAIIAASYYSIPIALWYFVSKRRDIAYRWVFWMFAAFILVCGTTHLMSIWTLWHPDYGVDAVIKLITAALSIPTAILLWPLIPKALALPSPAELEAANSQLTELNSELEVRVHRRTAELDRSNSELERFAYVASHDLKEPLNTTRSFLELLVQRTDGKLDAASQHLVNRSLASTQRLQGLITALLEYSRAGRRSHEFSDVDMPQMVERIRNALVAELDPSQYVMRYEGEPTVFTDASLLDAMLQNLVTNAIKYRSDRPLEIVIATQKTDTAWMIRVKDNGIGIAPEHHQLIFEMFQRLHTSSDIPGSGMGLAICKRIAEHLGGRIDVASELGVGTTFTIVLPIHAGHHDAAPQTESA